MMPFITMTPDVAVLEGTISELDNFSLQAWIEDGLLRTARLKLLISSKGGKLDFDSIAAIHLANVHTHVLADAQSTAALYFLAGAPRTCVEEADIALHFPQLLSNENATPETDITLRQVVYKIIAFLSKALPGDCRYDIVSFFFEPTACQKSECKKNGHWGRECDQPRILPLNLETLYCCRVLDEIGHLTPEYLRLDHKIADIYERFILNCTKGK